MLTEIKWLYERSVMLYNNTQHVAADGATLVILFCAKLMA